ncbi:ricin-type beta-trefoil lectin domain protein [Streptomyces sp. CC219B]|uniref:ricin-type beta-trefoil lectin domain protein n=1 Tax=Streptomyces sp. CC219B TaxID=3044574 RepID=UPI0024A9EC18|nr:ricin-type beta-trefoil lectin domain protein [Streptomyces sp. CC219B]
MQSPHPPRPPYPPRPGASSAESDRNLLARLGTADINAVPLLMARHWRAVHEYAVICLASPASSASMVTAAAFHRVLGNPSGGALRPQLLVAVRETVKEWATGDRISTVLPELRKTTGARGLRAARSVTPERRRLAERAFLALPGASQCLLWHTEVEAEPISVPAGLLGVDEPTASAALEQAREQFRAACVRAHRELAPTRECRFHNRLLEVPLRRGGSLLSDVRQHLTECRYCRHAAEQLSHFEGGLGDLLAETVLGWGARRYLDSRPGRAVPPVRPSGGRHRPAPARQAGRTKVAAGVGLLSLALLTTLLVARGWSGDNGVPDPHATWGAPSVSTVAPSAGPGTSSAASASRSDELGHGRLRNLGTGLCLDLREGAVRAGAVTVLAGCSSAGSQQWSYRDDGLLRSVADPTLCLDAETVAEAGRVLLADCLVHAGEVRYDLTVHGELLPRRGKGLAVAPGGGGQVIVTGRDGSTGQRWVLDPEGPEGSDGLDNGEAKARQGVTEPGEPGEPGEQGEPGASAEQRKRAEQAEQAEPRRAPDDARSPSPTNDPTPGPGPYETRVAEAAAEPEQPDPADALTLVSAVTDTVTAPLAPLLP